MESSNVSYVDKAADLQITQSSSYQHVWDYAYRMKCSRTELGELDCITLNPPSTERDWIEEQRFPQIHNIILGRSPKLLEAELDDNPDAVHATDAQGRTALDWATARAQLSDMRLLIACGSYLNTMDVSGRTTVLHAVDSHNDEALRIVLEAGANPNPKMPEGLFRSSPLTAASFGGLVGMIKLLIQSGAKVDKHNPEGRTALHAVASMNNVECADILLTGGADLYNISKNGHSPFTTAIMCNNHAVLKLFLERCHASRLKWPQLLPIIAESADAETISILASSDLTPKRPLLDRDGFAVDRETLRSRMDYDEKLGDAFEELFSVARADKEADAGRQTAASKSGYPSYLLPVEAGAEQQMATIRPVHPPRLASTFVDPQMNCAQASLPCSDTELTRKKNNSRLEYPSQAAALAARRRSSPLDCEYYTYTYR